MKRALWSLAALAAFLSFAPSAAAQPADGLRLGIRVGAYFPADEDVRDAFGEVLPLVGLALANPARPGTFAVFPNLEISGARSGSDRFLVIPLTAVGEYQFPGDPRGIVPFVRGEAGVAYYDYRVRLDSARVVRARRGGPAGAAEVGLRVTPYFRASARYRLFREYDDVDFSGLELNFVIGSLRLY
ncbi:MAG TPA: hypothetical protein VGR37_23760 [Longimicrobiaceae bacterium]|nr:hypothetical protein [Longimicrobiaceae bacterium]